MVLLLACGVAFSHLWPDSLCQPSSLLYIRGTEGMVSFSVYSLCWTAGYSYSRARHMVKYIGPEPSRYVIRLFGVTVKPLIELRIKTNETQENLPAALVSRA